MMQSGKKRILALALMCLCVLVASRSAWMKGGGSRAVETKVSIPAEEVIRSIRTATSAQPGNVLEVEAEKEKGRIICEVEILARDGKTYDVAVDIATDTVVKVENDDDDNDDDDSDDKN